MYFVFNQVHFYSIFAWFLLHRNKNVCFIIDEIKKKFEDYFFFANLVIFKKMFLVSTTKSILRYHSLCFSFQGLIVAVF
jgi:hypothetical protein